MAVIARKFWTLVLIAGTTQAATLPLRPGTFVLAGTPCKDPPFAAIFDYDGHQFLYPHATHCRSVIVSRQGSVYRVRETCSAAGDGSATPPSTTTSVYRILSRERVTIRQAHSKADSTYRWCAAESAGLGA